VSPAGGAYPRGNSVVTKPFTYNTFLSPSIEVSLIEHSESISQDKQLSEVGVEESVPSLVSIRIWSAFFAAEFSTSDQSSVLQPVKTGRKQICA
jgi:hypothetical protein